MSTPEKLLLGLLNLTVVGQDLAFFVGIGDGHLVWSAAPFRQGGREVFHFMAIPVAWSLAIELYFYAVAPFLVRRPARQIALIMGLSLAARIGAALCGLAADPFSYRFFPFELALFLAGALGYKAWAARPDLWRSSSARGIGVVAVMAIVFYPRLLGSWSDIAFFSPARIGTLLLVACALPAIHEWSRSRRWDRNVGELSFPLYLGHLLVIGLIPATGVFAAHAGLRLVAVLAVSLLVAWFVVRFVESGIEAWRRRNALHAGVAEAVPPGARARLPSPGG